MKSLIKKAIDHLKYPSTWNGLIALVTAAGVHVAPDLAGHVITVGVALAGLVSFFFSDSDVKK